VTIVLKLVGTAAESPEEAFSNLQVALFKHGIAYRDGVDQTITLRHRYKGLGSMKTEWIGTYER
jgi:hypothetical protein